MVRENVFNKIYSLFHILVHHTGTFGYSRRFTDLPDFKKYFSENPDKKVSIIWILYKSTVDPNDLYVQYELTRHNNADNVWHCALNGNNFPDLYCDSITEIVEKFEEHISNPK